MRRLVPVLTLFLAGCAARQPAPEAVAPAPVASPTPQARQLVGLTAQDLVGHFGHPALQVSEGRSMKLQFKSRRCVLDAYLYPGANGALRVTWVDTRLPSGLDTDQAACISDLENPS